MSAAPLTYNIKLYQGATYRQMLTWKAGDPPQAVNLTDCTARMHVRSEINLPTTLLNLTTANGGIVLGGTAGTIEIVIADTLTSGKSWREGVYDLEIVLSNGDVRRLIEGTVSMEPEVTRV
jgi:hypothetical protein